MSNQTTILLGATGEVGGHILRELLNSPAYQTIYVVGRVSINHLLEYHKVTKVIIDFDKPMIDLDILIGSDIFCAIGTGEPQNFERVDYGYVYSFARLCDGLVNSFNLVSAMGANSKTHYNICRLRTV